MKILIPPNGFAGQVQQTQANQLVRTRGMTNGTRRRKRKSSSSARPKRRASSARPKRRASSSKPARLVKGSAAAKRYMAKLRRMRRK